MGSASQALPNPNPSTYLGSGKLASVAAQVHDLAVDTVIVDDEISPGQQRNLEKALGEGVRVADRTALILDIFGQRAQTKEGKLQVCLLDTFYSLLIPLLELDSTARMVYVVGFHVLIVIHCDLKNAAEFYHLPCM